MKKLNKILSLIVGATCAATISFAGVAADGAQNSNAKAHHNPSLFHYQHNSSKTGYRIWGKGWGLYATTWRLWTVTGSGVYHNYKKTVFCWAVY